MDGSCFVCTQLKTEKKLLYIIVTTVLITIIICSVCAKIYFENQSEQGKIIVNGENLNEYSATFSKKDVLVPMIPILEKYGYTFEYESHSKIVVTKEDWIYHLSFEDLTLYLIESPAYEDDRIPHINLLSPAVGATENSWSIVCQENDIIVDFGTMINILESLHEKPMVRVDFDMKVIRFARRDE